MKAIIEVDDDTTELRIVRVDGEPVPDRMRRREQLERIAAAATLTLQDQHAERRRLQQQRVVDLAETTKLSVEQIASQVGVSRGQVRVWWP